MNHELWTTYADAIEHFEATAEGRLPADLLMKESGSLSVFYAPFDYINHNAKLVIVGITPGTTQAVLALETARDALRSGKSPTLALQRAKQAASFGGRMRTALIEMLDYIGVNDSLGLDSTAVLFTKDNDLAHFTSILRYPVFDRGKNYSRTLDPLSLPILRPYAESFIREISTFKQSMILPLGGMPNNFLESMARSGLVSEELVLNGLPHPSGANSERIAYFLGKKPKDCLSVKTNPSVIDGNRISLVEKVSNFPSAY